MTIFETQSYGAVVATVRDGDNGIEMKDCGRAFDLTVFSNTDDMTAFGLGLRDLTRLRVVVDEAITRLGSRIATSA